mmetsp:Transcript_12983/g.24777  ORF Transcript_12983/g.24777 Transcript_12983/m.24777 type:complete len:288 (+) Transcript_12983:208-1071(+)
MDTAVDGTQCCHPFWGGSRRTCIPGAGCILSNAALRFHSCMGVHFGCILQLRISDPRQPGRQASSENGFLLPTRLAIRPWVRRVQQHAWSHQPSVCHSSRHHMEGAGPLANCDAAVLLHHSRGAVHGGAGAARGERPHGGHPLPVPHKAVDGVRGRRLVGATQRAGAECAEQHCLRAPARGHGQRLRACQHAHHIPLPAPQGPLPAGGGADGALRGVAGAGGAVVPPLGHHADLAAHSALDRRPAVCQDGDASHARSPLPGALRAAASHLPRRRRRRRMHRDDGIYS